MAIKEVPMTDLMRPIDHLRKDFEEFDASDLKVVQLVGYDDMNYQSVRTAAIKVMHEYKNKIMFFNRNHKFYLVKE